MTRMRSSLAPRRSISRSKVRADRPAKCRATPNSSSSRNQLSGSRLTDELSSPYPPKSLRFFYGTSAFDIDAETERSGSDFYLLEIPITQPELFRKLDDVRYTPHDHSYGDPARFQRISIQPDYLGHAESFDYPSIWPVVVGSVVYVLLNDWKPDYELDEPEYLLFQSINLDTRVKTNLPAPFSPDWLSPKAVALQGKIYLFGCLLYRRSKNGETEQFYGEVFDPAINEWSIIRQPPNATELSGDWFIVSVGETEGKILFYNHPYGHTPHSAKMYIYDVIKDVWETHCYDAYWPIDRDTVVPCSVRGKEIINVDDNTFYWIDGKCGFICAFEWKTRRFYCGPVVGMELGVTVFRTVTLEHVWKDFFCLILFSNKKYHFTFLRVTKNKLKGTLCGFVLGCSMGSIKHDCVNGLIRV